MVSMGKNDAALRQLTQDLVAMAELVERNVDTAVMALVDNNSRFAYEVVSLDTDIDEMEIFIDRECLELLAAGRTDTETFRFLTAAMKINNDLERISNQAVIIAESVLALVGMPAYDSRAPEMVLDSLVASAEKDSKQVARAMRTARAAMALTRVGEYVKDIAEEVIYMREGIIVKHHEREFRGRRRKPRAAETAEPAEPAERN